MKKLFVPTKPSIEQVGDGVILRVRVQPKSSRDHLRIEADGRVRVALTAPPVEGSANKALREFLAKKLGVAKSAIELKSGGKSRDKTLFIAGVCADAVRDKLG